MTLEIFGIILTVVSIANSTVLTLMLFILSDLRRRVGRIEGLYIVKPYGEEG